MSQQNNNKNKVLGKCPNCGSPMYEGAYGSIPMKKPVSSEKIQESLMICSPCLRVPESLSPLKIGEHLLVLKLWEKEDVALAVSAVQEYKDARK